MEIFKEYLVQNWPLILILLAFVISLFLTVFADKKTIIRMCILIAAIFLLSIVVFVEFNVTMVPEYREARTVLMAIRYSATPLILAQVIYTNVKKFHWAVFIPALASLIINVISIFTGVVFSIDSENVFHRGPLGLLPFIVVGLYSALLIFLLIKRSNKRWMEIIPIIFLIISLGTGLILPFVLEGNYANIFCITIAIALFSYHEFSIHELTKKDSLTGLLNRHAYYADVGNTKNITAFISIDMNGLKEINDNIGHFAGDEALVTLSLCFMRALTFRQSAYRMGGDEFIIVCRKTSKEEVLMIVDNIKKNVAETKYSCSIGYSFNEDGKKTIDILLKESDEMMYANKEKYYRESGKDRRKA